MSIGTLTSPFSALDSDLQEQVREGSISALAAVSAQTKRLNRTGKEVPQVLRYAQNAHAARLHAKQIDQGDIDEERREVSSDYARRVYQSNFENPATRLYGKASRSFIARLAKGAHPEHCFEIHRIPDDGKTSNLAQSLSTVWFLKPLFRGGDSINQDQVRTVGVKRFFSWLTANNIMSDSTLKQLIALGKGNSNQGPGLGPMNERRAGLALAILKDAGLIKNFQICGEAGKPLTAVKSAEMGIDYAHHEEAMAIDIIVRLKTSKFGFEYLPLQIKSSGSSGFDTEERYLTFNPREKYIVEHALPETIDLFVENPHSPGSYRMKLKRRVYKLPLNKRKIIKEHKKDFDPDIVNRMIAVIDAMQAKDMTLLLDQPYSKLSYVDKVIELIKQGFLTPVKCQSSKEPKQVKAFSIFPSVQKMLEWISHDS